MAQRLLKIILPESHGASALDVLAEQGVIDFWQEESVGDHHVISVLIDAGQSESLMDRFEKAFSTIPGFRLILIPVEAAIPRVEVAAESPPDQPANLQPIDSARISREELYQDIVDSTKLSGFYVAMVLLSTVVAAIGLLKDNVAVIIGAMVIAPFLGPNVALALSTCLADYELGKNSLKTLVFWWSILLLAKLPRGLGPACPISFWPWPRGQPACWPSPPGCRQPSLA